MLKVESIKIILNGCTILSIIWCLSGVCTHTALAQNTPIRKTYTDSIAWYRQLQVRCEAEMVKSLKELVKRNRIIDSLQQHNRQLSLKQHHANTQQQQSYAKEQNLREWLFMKDSMLTALQNTNNQLSERLAQIQSERKLQQQIDSMNQLEWQQTTKKLLMDSLRNTHATTTPQSLPMPKTITPTDSATQLEPLQNLLARLQKPLASVKKDNVGMQIQQQKIRIVIKNDFLFVKHDLRLSEEGAYVLSMLARTLRSTNTQLQIVSHMSSGGFMGNEYAIDSWDLTALRATSVLRYLATDGVSERSMFPMGRAEFSPAEPTEELPQSQNRVEIWVSLVKP